MPVVSSLQLSRERHPGNVTQDRLTQGRLTQGRLTQGRLTGGTSPGAGSPGLAEAAPVQLRFPRPPYVVFSQLTEQSWLT